ncbi:MAG: hypothetical protein WCS18_11850 [Sphaerochaetaceae bacterium]
MLGYFLSRAAIGLAVVLLITAVLWETVHLVDWCMSLYTTYGDGTVAGYLRMHAYTYVSYIFGESPFGWVAGGA